MNVQGTQSAGTAQRNGTIQQTVPRTARAQPITQRNAANPANQGAPTEGAHCNTPISRLKISLNKSFIRVFVIKECHISSLKIA